MVSVFIREQRRYTLEELGHLLCCSERETVAVIKRLKEYGIVKAVKATDSQRNMSELLEEDVEVSDVESGNDIYYVFTYVGVITAAGRVLKCFPKYILHDPEPLQQLKQVLKVLQRYNAREQIIRMYSDSSDERTFNLLAVLLYLLNDYYENGSYSNTQDIIETNGTGEILWDRTINETFTLLSSNRPYYPNIQTKRRVVDEYDYFRRLHECVLSLATAELESSDLLELFDIMPVDLSDEVLDDFGERDYILYRIERELNVQYNTRKQTLLKALYSFVIHEGGLYDVDAFSMFGTSTFNLVWEKVCADVMDNQLETTLSALQLPRSLHPEYAPMCNQRLIDIIDKPVWIGANYSHTAKKTLIPDLVAISVADNDSLFGILDAKYYTPQLEPDKPLQDQPGIESITKQYLYQLAFQDFVEKHEFRQVINSFLFPTEGDVVLDNGIVSLAMLDGLGLERIKIRSLPATYMYDLYIAGKKLSLSELHLT